MFAAWRLLAINLLKVILVYYGAPGHGKGLVNGMSGFGVKGPLCNAIVTTYFFFNHAADIVKFLQESQEEHRNRHYFLLEKEQLQKKWPSERLQILKMKKSLEQHMFTYHPNGYVYYKKNICSCENCIQGELLKCSFEKGIAIRSISGELQDDGDDHEVDGDYTNEEDEVDDDKMMVKMTMN